MPKPPAANRNREPQSRSFVQWTPDLLRAAEVTADGGTLRLAADLCDAVPLTEASSTRWLTFARVHLLASRLAFALDRLAVRGAAPDATVSIKSDKSTNGGGAGAGAGRASCC